VSTSPDADHARRILDRTEKIDGVLLDIHRSGSHGLEFGKSLRTLWPRLKLFLMTGIDHALISKEGIRIGATAFLPKPFSLDTFHLMLASHLSSSQRPLR
jgi:DNA-binding NtrC family response regulator